MRPAVFLDRDDTLIEANSLPAPALPAACGDVVDPALVRLLPGVRDGCLRLRRAGFALIVVSNQGVVARGGADLETVERVNARLRELLPDPDHPTGRSLLDAVYCCPFHPRGAVPRFTREHDWRKPAPGMILAAARELELDLGRSWLIGDAPRDLDSAMAAGIAPARCVLIGGSVARDFASAVDAVLAAPG